MKKEVVELLEAKFIYGIKSLNTSVSRADVERKKYYFINYGLKNVEYAAHCLDFLDMTNMIFDELYPVSKILEKI